MYIFLKSLFFILAILPIRLKLILAKVIGFIISALPIKENKIAALQLKKFLKVQNPKIIVRKMWQNIAENFLLFSNLNPILDNVEKTIAVDKPDLFFNLVNTRIPTIALTAHTGNWDLLAGYAAVYTDRLVSIGRPIRNKHLQDLLNKLRLKYKIKTNWRSNVKDSKDIIKSLENGNVIGVLIDQDTKVKSIFSEFCGTLCKTPFSIIDLGKKYNSSFISAFIFKTGTLKYKIFLSEIDNTLSNQEIIDIYHRNFEELIKEYPEQWVWFHKRWRTRPETGTMSSKEYLQYLTNV